MANDLAADFMQSLPGEKKTESKTKSVTLDDHAFKIVEKWVMEKHLSKREAASSLIRIADQRLETLEEEKDKKALETPAPRKAGAAA